MNYPTKEEIFAAARKNQEDKKEELKKRIANSLAYEAQQNLVNDEITFVISSNNIIYSAKTSINVSPEDVEYKFWTAETSFARSYEYTVTEDLVLEVLETMGFTYDVETKLKKQQQTLHPSISEFYREIHVTLKEDSQ